MKELTLDVQNVIAPPKTKIKVAKKEKNLAFEGDTEHTSDAESKFAKSTEDDQVAENGVVGTPKAGDMLKNSVSSPSARSSHGSPRDGFKDNHFRKLGSSDASPRAKESLRYAFFCLSL